MEIMKSTLREGLPQLGLELSEERIDTLCAFGKAVARLYKACHAFV